MGTGQERPQLKRPEQMPEVKPPEKKKLKKGKEPRAVGVLELNSGGKGTLIPVAILIDGKFYDASAYKADPVPMALESGTVYEAEQSGDSEGLFTVNGARHSKAAGSANPWVGTGSYLPKGAEAPKSMRRAEDKPVGLDDSGDEPPPRLTRKDTAKPGASSDAGTSGTAAPGTAGSGASEKTGSTTAGSSQPASGSATAGPKAGPDTAKGADGAAADKPTDSNGKQTAGAAGGPGAGQTSGDYYRPQLRRGKPTVPPPPDEDDAVIAKKREVGNSAAEANPASAGPMRMVAAISDEAGPDPQSYKFFWKTGEEDERLKQMMAAAEDAVKAYVAALAKNQISARPATPKAAAGHKSPGKAAQPVLENVQFHGFDLWLTNQPVMILSAEAHMPAAPGGNASAIEPYSVTVVARTDIYGDLRKLYSGVTDKFHLDVTPRLELIDVVDADGDGRGELLFRETTDVGSGFLIYRATADKLWKIFDSLNAE